MPAPWLANGLNLFMPSLRVSVAGLHQHQIGAHFIVRDRHVEDTMSEHLTLATFKDKVFDYENEKEWKYRGTLPAIIDFYADWCGPCKMVAPVLEKLAKKYDGKLHVYKVNTEDEQELAGMFGIQSIPTLLFIPVEGQPRVSMGAMPEKEFERIIADVLMVPAEA